MHRVTLTILVTLLLLPLAAESGSAQTTTRVRLGYFEGGEHPLHYLVRDEFQRQLVNLMPSDTEIVFVPEGYRSASWVRDSSRLMARQLVGIESVDVMVAMGPWVVEDLLAAGWNKPIIGIRQIDPYNAGLLGPNGQPVAPNLTVQDLPKKIEDDIGVLSRLVRMKKLGVLWFDTGTPEQDSIVARVQRAAALFGAEAVTADGYNRVGTYAFFNAFNSLPKDIDALYVGPLWGLTLVQINEFLKMCADRRIPVMTWEGKFLAARGGFGTNYAYGLVSEAHFQVLKLLRIARGERPADLPVLYRGGSSLAVNAATARQVGVELPAEVLLSAEVIGSLPPPPPTWFTLADALSRVVASNPSYLATYDAIEAASRGARAVSSGYLPNVALEGRAGWIDDHTINNTVEPLQNGQYRASLVLNQPIFSPELLQARKVAAQQTKLAEVAQREARLDLELAVATGYLSHLRSIEELRVEERYRELVERTLEYAASVFYLRELRQADLLRWQDERQVVLARVSDAENAVYTSRVLLNLLFNLPPEEPLNLDTAIVSQQTIGLDYSLLAPLAVKPESRRVFEALLVEAAREASPVMAAEDVRLDLQRARLSASGGRYWPSVELRAAFNLADEIDDDLGVIDEETTTWGVFGFVRFPLFLGGKRGQERAQLKASLSEFEYRRDAAMLDVQGGIRRETGNLLSSIVSLPNYARSSELALAAMPLVLDDYEGYRRDLTAVIEAYRHARGTELKEIASRYDYMLSLARLVRTVGWSPSSSFTDFHGEFLERVRQALARER